MGGAQVQSLTPTPLEHFGPSKRGVGVGGTKNHRLLRATVVSREYLDPRTLCSHFPVHSPPKKPCCSSHNDLMSSETLL